MVFYVFKDIMNHLHAPYILSCQNDSYQKSLYDVQVLACYKICEDDLVRFVETKHHKSKQIQESKFRIQLSNTNLFPEGGGQPYDTGSIQSKDAQVSVLAVYRDTLDGTTWHFTAEKLNPGTSVDVFLNWKRRFDHMQCHSAQHLITAITEKHLSFPTVGWSLTMGSHEPCHIDIECTRRLERSDLNYLEEHITLEILDNKTVTTTIYEPLEFAALENVRQYQPVPIGRFPIRVVEILGLDRNPCCGTHVKSTGDIQAIKLLKVETIKNQSKNGKIVCRVYFVAGSRVNALLGALYEVSTKLSDRFSCSFTDHVARVDNILSVNRAGKKLTQNLVREIATFISKDLVVQARLQSTKNSFP